MAHAVKCGSFWAALWEGHGLEVATVESPVPLTVTCTACGTTYRTQRARVIGCLDCNVGLEMGDNFCEVCTSSEL